MTVSLNRFWKTFITISLAVSALAIYQTQVQTQAFLKIRSRYKWVVVMGLFAVNLLLGIYLLLRREQDGAFWRKFKFDPSHVVRMIFGMVIWAAVFPILWYVKFDFFGRVLPDFFPFLWVFLWLALAQALGLRLLTRFSWAISLAFALLLDGLALQLYTIFNPSTRIRFHWDGLKPAAIIMGRSRSANLYTG